MFCWYSPTTTQEEEIAMSDCTCKEHNKSSSEHVADYSVVGFGAKAGSPPQLDGVLALRLSVCVGASYNQATNQICFTIPVYGDYCLTSPVSIPVSGQLKVCAETCGSFIPTGLKATVYLNGTVLFTATLFGAC
jgi:hypothetical protein